jgi:small subunit ribosomal protein S15
MPEAKEEKTKETKKEKVEKPKTTEKEFEKKVLELAEKGLTSEKIGEELRKQNIHSKEFSKKISKILKENDLYVDADLKNVEKKHKKIEEHVKKNKQDKRAIREKSRIFSQIRKLKKYRKLI